MINNTVNKISQHRCITCGSPLILISQETVKPEGTRYSQTNTVYRCSNADCQQKKDKEKAERLKQREKKEILEKERIEKIQAKKKLTQESKAAID